MLRSLFLQIKNPHFYFMFFLDLLLFVLAHVSAYLLRFDFLLKPADIAQIKAVLPILVLIKVVCFLSLGVYRGLWRYTGLNDMVRLLWAVGTSSLLCVALMSHLTGFKGFSRGVFVLDGGMTFLFAGGLRVIIRMAYQRMTGTRGAAPASPDKEGAQRRSVLIIGAGDAGEKTVREILDNPKLPYKITGFLDDDRVKKGRTIHGIPVLGSVTDLPWIVETKGVEEVFIAIPTASGPQMRTVVELCERTAIPYKTLPGLGDLMDGSVSVKALRDVRYEDLLGRPPVNLDLERISGYLRHQTILVTGAGGSIGSELCRQLLRFQPASLVLLDASEPGLYEIQMEMKHRKGYLKYRTVLGSVCDRRLIEQVFRQYQPDVVFHAAAYKHVPMLERNPWQAVTNNIGGTRTLLETAVEEGCGTFVMISTDKAVRPTNVMGASKRVCERLLYAYLGGPGRLMAVRFGNVVGSAGSVVPLFRKQIERGGPITVTHPDVTRYFMTIPEACQLVLQAGSLGNGGEIFILEMGTPVRIADMARDLVRLSGKAPGIDIEITFTGLRPGEKLFEELITSGEGIVRTEHEKIHVLRADGCYSGYGDQEGYRRWLLEAIADLEERTHAHDAKGIKAGLKRIVPEYMEQEADCVI